MGFLLEFENDNTRMGIMANQGTTTFHLDLV